MGFGVLARVDFWDYTYPDYRRSASYYELKDGRFIIKSLIKHKINQMKRFLSVSSFFSLEAVMLTIPVLVAHAADTTSTANLQVFINLVNDAQKIVNVLVPIVFTIALLVFFWGLAKFILSAGDEEARKGGRQVMIWGIIAIAVMASVWGLVGWLQTIFGVTPTSTITVPHVNTPTP